MTSRTYLQPTRPRSTCLTLPGAFTQPYLFDTSLLDRRAQPLYNRPHYQPIECMIFDKRPSASTEALRLRPLQKPMSGGTPCTTAKVAAAYRAGLCSSCRTSCAYLQTRLRAQSPQHRPTMQPICLPPTLSGRSSAYQLITAHPSEGSGIWDALGPTTLAPQTHLPDRLQSRSGETCSLKTYLGGRDPLFPALSSLGS